MSIIANIYRIRRPAQIKSRLAVTVQPKTEPNAVAVIIPCHNYGRYLKECLLSIISQSHPAAEIIVVDDASTDDTASVACDFSASVKYLRIDARNPHEARRAGIAATTAPLLCCVDADDQLTPGYLQKAAALFADPSVGIVWSPVQEFGESTKAWRPKPGDINQRNWIHAGAVVRRAAITRSRAFETPNEFIREDYEVWRRIINDGWQTAMNPESYLYRKHAGSRSSLVPRQMDKVVVAVYYTTFADPQRNARTRNNCWSKVAAWVLSLKKLGLQGVILHDNLSPAFAARCAQHGVECTKVPVPEEDYGNCWRYFAYLEWLKNSAVKTAFFTDLFDVHLNADPFSLLRNDYDLWVGIETEQISQSKWMRRRMEMVYGKCPDQLKEKQVLNCGIIGGFREPLLRLFQSMVDEILLAKQEGRPVSNDMPFFNHVLHAKMSGLKLWAKGAPLHSVFKAYDTNAPVAFVHK